MYPRTNYDNYQYSRVEKTILIICLHVEKTIIFYKKLLSDKLSADLGYLYENVVAQAIKSSGRDLYYHTWRKEGSTHSFKVDFLIASKNKVVPIEVKSSAVKNHKSIDNFEVKYSKQVGERFLLSQKDVGKTGTLKLKPVYMILFLLKDLS